MQIVTCSPGEEHELGVFRGRILRRMSVTEIKEVMVQCEPKVAVYLKYKRFLLLLFINWHSR
jgi:hypothetical protein